MPRIHKKAQQTAINRTDPRRLHRQKISVSASVQPALPVAPGMVIVVEQRPEKLPPVAPLIEIPARPAEPER
jgi:hypothetical protein